MRWAADLNKATTNCDCGVSNLIPQLKEELILSISEIQAVVLCCGLICGRTKSNFSASGRGERVSQRLRLIQHYTSLKSAENSYRSFRGCAVHCCPSQGQLPDMRRMASQSGLAFALALFSLLWSAPLSHAISALPDGVICAGGEQCCEFCILSGLLLSCALRCGIASARFLQASR